MIYTNGEICGPGKDEGQIRMFLKIHQDGDDMWVKAMNGNYKGERLTFKISALRLI